MIKQNGEYVLFNDLIGEQNFTIIDDENEFKFLSKEEDDEIDFMIKVKNEFGTINQTFSINIFGEFIMNLLPINNINLPFNDIRSINLKDLILTNGEIFMVDLRINNELIFGIRYDTPIQQYTYTEDNIDILYEYFEDIGGVIFFSSENVLSDNDINITVSSMLDSVTKSDSESFNLLVGSFAPKKVEVIGNIILNFNETRKININDYFNYYDDFVLTLNKQDLEIVIIESFGNTEYQNEYFAVSLINDTLTITSKDKDYAGYKLRFLVANEEGYNEENVILQISKKSFISNIFADSETLTNMEKFLRIFGVMGLIIFLGIVLSRENPNSKGILIPVVAMLIIFAFIFFVFIKYIPLWIFVLIILIVIGGVVGFMRRTLVGDGG